MNIKLPDDIEYIVHCDESGSVIGPISKKHAHLKGVRETLAHKSTWCMVYHPASKRFGVQKKAAKDTSLSSHCWDVGVAGHNNYIELNGIFAPMTFAETLVKESAEELGLTVSIVDPQVLENYEGTSAQGYIFDEFHFKVKDNNEHVGLGIIFVPSQKVNFVDGEVEDFVWLTYAQLELFLQENSNYSRALPLTFEKMTKIQQLFK